MYLCSISRYVKKGEGRAKWGALFLFSLIRLNIEELGWSYVHTISVPTKSFSSVWYPAISHAEGVFYHIGGGGGCLGTIFGRGAEG